MVWVSVRKSSKAECGIGEKTAPEMETRTLEKEEGIQEPRQDVMCTAAFSACSA